MELIDKIKAGSQIKKTIDWPGADDAKVDLRIMTESDHLQASLEANKMFKETKIGAENVDTYSAEQETQLLFRAIVDPDSGKQLFKSMAEFRRALIPEVKDVIADELDRLHEEYSPEPTTISDAEFDKLVQDVKKNAEEVITKLSDINTLRKLSLFLASPQ